jgi:hypothetical protein
MAWEAPMRDLTEDEVLEAIRTANLGGNTIRLTFDSGPYEVTRTTRVADLLAQAIVRKFCEVNGLPEPAHNRGVDSVDGGKAK